MSCAVCGKDHPTLSHARAWEIAKDPVGEENVEPPERTTQFRQDITTAINRASKENGSNTPDFILAQYLEDCLVAFDKASRHREQWYGKGLSISDLGDVASPTNL